MQVNVLQNVTVFAVQGDFSGLQQGLPRGRFGNVPKRGMMPYHQESQLVGVRFTAQPFGNHLACPHDIDPVGDRHHFLQFVGDQDNAFAGCCQVFDRFQQAFHFQRCQNRAGLVKDDDLRALV